LKTDEKSLSRLIVFEGKTLFLFVSGLVALSIVPFLNWVDYGLNFKFPAQVSLIWLFERGFYVNLVLYLIGVVVAVLVTAAFRRPVFFLGILPVAFPIFIFAISASKFFLGYEGTLLQMA